MPSIMGICNNQYVVVAGDTALEIALKHKITLQHLLSQNKRIIHNPDVLFIGQKLCVQEEANFNSECNLIYNVISGDICDLIAKNSKLTFKEFSDLNPGLDCSNLQIGQILCIGKFGDITTPPEVDDSTATTSFFSTATTITTATLVSTAKPETTTSVLLNATETANATLSTIASTTTQITTTSQIVEQTQPPAPIVEPPPPEPAPAPPVSRGNADAGSSISAHNQCRAAAGISGLGWDEGLAASSQEYADVLASNGCSLQHARGDFGENLYMTSGGSQGSESNAVDAWCSEDLNSFNHHTQVIWRGTSSVGCGVSSNWCGTVVVCRYYPRGNMGGSDWFS
ncbi:hypothetical protein HK099_001694 [Clydaea vesicula]|uniref:LysM domain-containing protein n=1 Tax=Clydaea vesicula TaxID=447962 RepID=A0AAD5XRY4_9FUNG|nr:hypothetical protein HK099_001694 [Clydaea vesicula]